MSKAGKSTTKFVLQVLIRQAARELSDSAIDLAIDEIKLHAGDKQFIKNLIYLAIVNQQVKIVLQKLAQLFNVQMALAYANACGCDLEAKKYLLEEYNYVPGLNFIKSLFLSALAQNNEAEVDYLIDYVRRKYDTLSLTAISAYLHSSGNSFQDNFLYTEACLKLESSVAQRSDRLLIRLEGVSVSPSSSPSRGPIYGFTPSLPLLLPTNIIINPLLAF